MQLSSFREEPLEKVESRDSLHGILCLQCCFRALKGKDSEISCSFLVISVVNDHSLCQAKSLSFPLVT